MAADQDLFFDAEEGVFKLNDGSSLQTMSPYVKEVRGLPGQVKVHDVTAFGSTGERPGMSLFVSHFNVTFMFNMVTSVGVHTILGAMFANKALRAFEYSPAGTTVGNAKISGSAYLVVYEIVSRVGDYVTVNAEFRVDNAITIGAN